jgi:plastocyanin
MRRVFALLLLTPLVASCADSATPVAPAGAVMLDEVAAPEGEWPAEENWYTPGGALTLLEDEMSVQDVGAQAAPTTPNLMVFGNPESGSSFSPPGSHDQSFHARDKINPGSMVINAGETVNFLIYIGHRVAIYDDGVKPTDIQQTPGPLLLDPNHRLFLQPFPTPQFKLKFVRPGKYLVVCAINQHFFVGNMWGWIIVK